MTRSALMLFALLLAALAHPAHSAAPAADVLNAQTDPRLAKHILLRSEGVPVSHVLRRLGEKSGVILTAPGDPGDERLVAFAPDAPLAEVLRSIADLYRLRWVRGGTAERPTYQLVKPIAAAREEAALKERALRESLAEINRQLKEPPRDRRGDPDGHFAALREAAAQAIRANWDALAAESHLEVPIADLPAPQKGVFREHGPAVLQQLQQDVYESEVRTREAILKQGQQLPPSLEKEPQLRPVPPIEQCKLTLDLKTNEGLEFSCMLSTPSFASTLAMGKAGHSEAAGITLYADRRPRPPAPGTPGAPAGDALDRPLEVENGALLQSSHLSTPWLTAMENLANTAHLAVYSDDYSNPDSNGKQRDAEPLRNGLSAAEYLDRLCRQPNREAPACFWWRRDGAVLLRSRGFLQEADSVIPAALTDSLIAHSRAMGKRGALAVMDLTELSRLTFPQLRGLARWGDPIEAWKRSIQVTARLSPTARGLTVSDGLTWENMPEADRALASQLSRGAIGPGYRAHVTADVSHPSWRSKSSVSLGLETERTPGSAYRLSLPAPQINPQGLLVMDPARARGGTAKPERLVFALYYPWYGLEAVSGQNRKVQPGEGKIRNFAHYPAAGPYDSTDEAVVRRQLRQMREAGVDVAACYWPGPGSFEDKAVRKLLPLAKAEGLRVCLSLDDVKVESATEFRNKLTGWVKDLGADPAYLRVEGRPVLFMGYSMQTRFSLQEWVDLFEALETSAPPGVFAVIPGFTPLDSIAFSGTNVNAHNSWEPGEASSSIARRARESMASGAAAARRYGRVVVAQASTGFDIRHLDKDHSPIDRNDGAYYRALWEGALETGADWVVVDSFNQWEIGSEIEPSREFGDAYLKLTAEYAARFKTARPAK